MRFIVRERNVLRAVSVGCITTTLSNKILLKNKVC